MGLRKRYIVSYRIFCLQGKYNYGVRSALENFADHTHFNYNLAKYMIWSLTASKSGHQKCCQFISTHLKSADEVKDLLHQHFTVRPCALKKFFCFFFAIKGPKMV